MKYRITKDGVLVDETSMKEKVQAILQINKLDHTIKNGIFFLGAGVEVEIFDDDSDRWFYQI